MKLWKFQWMAVLNESESHFQTLNCRLETYLSSLEVPERISRCQRDSELFSKRVLSEKALFKSTS